ncbi:hypothetical protein Tco_0981207, partial [Tanacetum coccineum]
MMTYLKNTGGYKHSQLKGKTYEEIHELYERQQKRNQDFIPMDSEKEVQESGKRLKRVAGSYATQKSTKKPTVMKSVKNITEEEAAEYEKKKEELRADGSSSYHGDMQAFLRRLDRQDLKDLYSQLKIHGAAVLNEDANQKFLRALPSSWNNIALIMRNKEGIDELDIDDLYNNLKVFEADIKAGHSSQRQASSSSYTNDLMFSFFADKLSGPQLDDEELEQLDQDNLEEMDIKWQ